MKRGTPRHPKMRDLCEQLKCALPTAIGHLELLWHFTAEFAPQGDIGRYSDKRIEGALEWRKSSGGLVKALVTSGWVDADPDLRLIVHDWHQHADDAVRKRLMRAGLSFLTDRSKLTGQIPTMSGTHPDNGSLPEPEPEPKPVPEPEARRQLAPPIPFPSLQSWQMDETYAAFVEVYREVSSVTGKPLLEEDFAEAHFRWGRLDFDQKVLAVDNLRKRLSLGVWTGASDPQFIPLPKKYLELEYKRPVIAPRPRDSPRVSATHQAMQMAREEELRRAART